MKIRYASNTPLPLIQQVNYLRVRRPGGYQVSFSNGRKSNSFLYTVSGEMCYTLRESDGQVLHASAGTLIYLPAGTRHTTTYLAPANEVQMIQFDLEISPTGALSLPKIVPLADAGRLFGEIQSDLQMNQREESLYLLYRCTELLWKMQGEAQALPPSARKLQPALHELQNSYADNHSIPYYARLCGMSEPGFRRLFKSYTGMSPLEYRTTIRMQQAQRLLRSGEFTVEEAAYMVGFSSSSFFCRCYKKAYGHSPGQE